MNYTQFVYTTVTESTRNLDLAAEVTGTQAGELMWQYCKEHFPVNAQRITDWWWSLYVVGEEIPSNRFLSWCFLRAIQALENTTLEISSRQAA